MKRRMTRYRPRKVKRTTGTKSTSSTKRGARRRSYKKGRSW